MKWVELTHCRIRLEEVIQKKHQVTLNEE